MKLFIIVSNYYPDISNMLLKGTIKELRKNKINKYSILKVRGTLEIPIVVSKIISKSDAIIVLGCAIKGKTKHFDLIASSVTNSILNLSTSNKKPIGNGILYCYNKKQALHRSDPRKSNKGGEATSAVLSVLNAFKKWKK